MPSHRCPSTVWLIDPHRPFLPGVRLCRMRSGRPGAMLRRRWVGLVVLLAVAIYGPVGAADQAPPPTLPAPSAPAGPKPIPVTQIAAQAEDTVTRLRAIEAGAAPVPGVAPIERRLPTLEENLSTSTDDTYQVLRDSPSLTALEDLLDPWERVREQARVWLALLTARAEDLESSLKRLDEIRERWRVTQAAAPEAGAPEATAGRIQDTLVLIESTRDAVSKRLDEVLVLQDRVAQVLSRADEMMEQIYATRRGLLGQLLVRDGLPIWGFFLRSEPWDRARQRAGRSIGAEVPAVRLFVEEHAEALVSTVLLFVALGLWLRRMRDQARRWTALDDSLEARFRPLDHPWAASALVALLLAGATPPPEPRALEAMAALAAMVPIIWLIASLTPSPLVPAVWIMGGLHVVDLVRTLLSSAPLLEQAIFLLQLVALVVGVAWLRRHLARVETDERRRRRWEQLGRAALVLATVALVAALLGWLRLARAIEFALVAAGQYALVLWALVRLAEALLAWALRVRPLRLLCSVQEHREAVERRLQGLARLAATLLWGVGLAHGLAIWGPVSERVAAVLGARVGWGAVHVSLSDLLAFGLVVWLTFLISQAIRALLEEDVFARVNLGRGIAIAVSSLAHYAILLIGFFLGLGALGIDLTRITIVAGALGVGVGFGLQNVVNNFVSGLVLLFERPIQVGDTVQLGALTGEVKRIGIRSSTVRTWEGAEVIVPNASLVSDQVTNWTLSDRMRRIDLDVGVAYGTDPQRVVALLAEVARANPGVLPDPVPVVLFMGFGDSALNFQLRAWTARFEEWLGTRSELGLAVVAALREAGIGIPFPQRDLHIVQESPTQPAGGSDGSLTR